MQLSSLSARSLSWLLYMMGKHDLLPNRVSSLAAHAPLVGAGQWPSGYSSVDPLITVCRLSVQQNWAKLAETNLQGSFTKKVQQRLLWDNSLGLPSWSDEEWQQISDNSLPAALQHHIWPAQSRISPRSEVRPTYTSAGICCCACVHRLNVASSI